MEIMNDKKKENLDKKLDFRLTSKQFEKLQAYSTEHKLSKGKVINKALTQLLGE
jgi:hypothetical protein